MLLVFLQDEDPEQKSAGAGLIEAYVSDTVDQITAEIVSDDVRQLEQTNSHLQMSPEAVSAVESMTLQASATTEPSGVAHQNQPEKKAVDLDVYQVIQTWDLKICQNRSIVGYFNFDHF